MRILCVTHYFAGHGGGIEIVAGRVAEALARRGAEVAWAATDIGGEVAESAKGVRLLPMRGSNLVERMSGLPVPIWSPRSLRVLRSEIERSDVVHCHDGFYAGTRVAIRAARRWRRPVVVTQHIGEIPFENLSWQIAMRLANRAWTRPALRRSSRVVFVSDSVARFFSDTVPPERAVTIYNGVDCRLFRPSPEPRAVLRERLGLDPKRPVFLFVGRFVAKKGLARLRAAAAELRDVQWILIGRGPIDPESWKLANVRVVGPVAQGKLPSWYSAADLLALPSVGEGFPLVVQEAMSCGLPCLVSEETRQGCAAAAPHLFSAGKKAVRFLESCRDALARREDHEALRDPLARAAAALWSWERCAAAYDDLFADLSRSPAS